MSTYDEWKLRGPKMKESDGFNDHFCDWEMDYFRDYIKHDVFAYQELITLMGAPGKELPTDTDDLSMDQEETLLELARSQTAWWDKFTQHSFEEFCARREGPDND